ncbi:CAP-Gly domain-containing linker protein 1 [Smittium culicis]|uniref:CAP-Gly domain-containing linker protein 1 n=1 Tax=Smittium culicis TaxID=133412 RepID=A0A1R1XPS4_9FUNG|nr:CAP-Gly domain-containing linker protein 1 [Smittium culicis]
MSSSLNSSPSDNSPALYSINRGRTLLKNISESPFRKNSTSLSKAFSPNSNLSSTPNLANNLSISSPKALNKALKTPNSNTNSYDSLLSSISSDQTSNLLVPPFLKIGVPVHVGSIAENGILRYLGQISSKPGVWAGVELDTPGKGKNDGSAMGYFNCPENKGIFILPSKLSERKDLVSSRPSEPSNSDLSNPKKGIYGQRSSRLIALSENANRASSLLSTPSRTSSTPSSTNSNKTTSNKIPSKTPNPQRRLSSAIKPNTSSSIISSKFSTNKNQSSLSSSKQNKPPIAPTSKLNSTSNSYQKSQKDSDKSQYTPRYSNNHDSRNNKNPSSSNFESLDIVANSGAAALSNRKLASSLSNYSDYTSSNTNRLSSSNRNNRSSIENRAIDPDWLELREKSKIELLEAENRMLRLEKEQSKAQLTVSRYFSQDLSIDGFSVNDYGKNPANISFDFDPDASANLEFEVQNLENKLIQEREFFSSKISLLEAELASKLLVDQKSNQNQNADQSSTNTLENNIQSPLNTSENTSPNFDNLIYPESAENSDQAPDIESLISKNIKLSSDLLKTKDLLSQVTASAQENSDLAQESQIACQQLEAKVNELELALNASKSDYESALYYMKLISEHISTTYIQINNNADHEPWLFDALLFDSSNQISPKDWADHSESVLTELRSLIHKLQNSTKNSLSIDSSKLMETIPEEPSQSISNLTDTSDNNDNNYERLLQEVSESAEIIAELETRIKDLEEMNMDLVSERNDTILQTSQVRDYIYKLESEGSRLIDDISILHSENVRLTAELNAKNGKPHNSSSPLTDHQNSSPISSGISNSTFDKNSSLSPTLGNSLNHSIDPSRYSLDNSSDHKDDTNVDEKIELLRASHQMEINQIKQQMNEMASRKDNIISKLNEELNELESIIENKVFKYSELEDKLTLLQKNSSSKVNDTSKYSPNNNIYENGDDQENFNSNNKHSNSNKSPAIASKSSFSNDDSYECELCNEIGHNILDCPTLNPPSTINMRKN